MLLKGRLNIHTTCSDGSLTAQEIAGIYARLGFDCDRERDAIPAAIREGRFRNVYAGGSPNNPGHRSPDILLA